MARNAMSRMPPMYVQTVHAHLLVIPATMRMAMNVKPIARRTVVHMARNAMSRMPRIQYVQVVRVKPLLATQDITNITAYVKPIARRTVVHMARNAMSLMPQMYVQTVSVPLLATQDITDMAVRVKQTV